MDYKRLTNVLTAAAIKALGGPVGDDYTADAEDLAQDVILKLLERELSEDDYFKLGTKMVQDLAIDLRRTEQRRREIEDEHGDSINRNLTGQSAEVLAADPHEILAYEEMRDRLDQLSPLLYSTTTRHYIDGQSVTDIAERDGVSADVIYKRLQRARNFVESGEDYGETH